MRTCGCGWSEDKGVPAAVRKRLQTSGLKVVERGKWLDPALHNGSGIANGTKYNDAHYNHAKN